MQVVKELEKSNPYILTTIDGRAVFMNKHNPIYEPKKMTALCLWLVW